MKPALRFLTAGSVDDGKSTLIGRLLHDGQALLADELERLHRRGAAAPDLALVTDGLEAEREQGITIDVAYRYFATRERKFIVADAPGHEQYTRNMVTAAAGSDAAVVLVDVTKLDTSRRPVALLPQTRRHALLARLLRVPHLVFAVNKLDAVADPRSAFDAVRDALLAFAGDAGIEVAGIVPMSALHGDNVTRPSALAGYDGPPLLSLLENLCVPAHDDTAFALLPVQFVQRDGGPDPAAARTLWGRVAQGRLHVGDVVEIQPGGGTARIAGLRHHGHAGPAAAAGRSVGVTLDRALDVARGDWLATPGSTTPATAFRATLCWLDPEPAVVGRRYRVRHGHRWVAARIVAIEARIDIHDLGSRPAERLDANDIGTVTVSLATPLPLLPFAASHGAGAMIVVDPTTHRTSGALLVDEVHAGAAP